VTPYSAQLVFKADVPLDIKSVFYIPAMNSERFGMRQLPPGVHLYCRRVLIQRNAPDLLPSYLSWISGVVDSEDLPLSISRESMQDQRKMANLKSVVTKRIIKWLTDEAKRVPDDYKDFYGQFGYKIKEGVASDRLNAASLAALLRYPSSATTDTEPAALEQYVARMPEGQDTIYYLVAEDRRVAEASPYYEAFKRAGLEVLFCYHEHDEVVLGNLGQVRDTPLKSIEEVPPARPPPLSPACPQFKAWTG
jgi:TNF receptor-associated protein 1